MRITNPLAVFGEDYATNYLSQNGYKILERNFRRGYGEIDIIAVDFSPRFGEVLVFIEVKSRSSDIFGSPFESIPGSKLKTLTKTAQYYKFTHPNLPEDLRIDAIGIVVSPDKSIKSFEHLKNITGY